MIAVRVLWAHPSRHGRDGTRWCASVSVSRDTGRWVAQVETDVYLIHGSLGGTWWYADGHHTRCEPEIVDAIIAWVDGADTAREVRQ